MLKPTGRYDVRSPVGKQADVVGKPHQPEVLCVDLDRLSLCNQAGKNFRPRIRTPGPPKLGELRMKQFRQASLVAPGLWLMKLTLQRSQCEKGCFVGHICSTV